MTCGTDKKIAAWEVYDGSLIRELEASTATIFGLDVTADGRRLVSGGEDKIIKVGWPPCSWSFCITLLQLWKYNEGEVTHVSSGHSGVINSVKVSPDQTFIIVASDSGIFQWAFPKA